MQVPCDAQPPRVIASRSLAHPNAGTQTQGRADLPPSREMQRLHPQFLSRVYLQVENGERTREEWMGK